MQIYAKYINSLKRKFVILCCALMFISVNLLKSQVITNNGASIFVSSGAVVTCADVVNKSDTMTNHGNIILSGNYKNIGVASGDGVYKVAANWTDSGTFNPGTSRVVLTGGNQAIIKNGTENFHKLILEGTGTKTAAQPLIINDSLTLANGASITPSGIELKGHYTDFNTGDAFNETGGKLFKLNGSAHQNIYKAGTQSLTIGSLEMDNSQGATLIAGNVTVHPAGTFKMTAGNITTGVNRIIIDNNNATALTRITGTIIGYLQRAIGSTTSNYLFPVGTDTSYHALDINFTNLTPGNYLVTFKTGDIGNSGLPLNDYGVDVHEQFKQGYWNTWALGSFASSKYDVSLVADKFGIDAATRILKFENNQHFISGKHDTVIGNEIKRDTLQGISTSGTIFALGKGRPIVSDNPDNDTVCHGTSNKFSINATGQGPLTYQWKLIDTHNDSTILTDNAMYSGTHTPTLSITGITNSMNGYKYKCTVFDAPGHPKHSYIAILRVNPIPDIDFTKNGDTICNTSYVTINPTSAIATTNYAWAVMPDAGITGASPDTGLFISNQLFNGNLDASKVVYAVKPIGIAPTFCIGPAKNDSIWVEPTVNVNFSALSDTVCNNGRMNISLSSPNKATTGIRFKYDIETPTGISVARNKVYNITPGSALTDSLNNILDTFKVVKYIVSPYTLDKNFAEKCTGVPDTFTVYVNPTPKISVNLSENIYCDSANIPIQISTVSKATGPIMYRLSTDYTKDSVANVKANSEYYINNINEFLINNSLSYQTLKYTFKPIIKNYRFNKDCDESEAISKTIYLNPTPRMSIASSDSLYCDSTDISFALKSLNGNVLGDRFYEISTLYNSDSTNIAGTLNGIHRIANFNHSFVNKSGQMQTITYQVTPVFRNPRGNDTTQYCSKGKAITIKRYILPSIILTPLPKQYAKGTNITCKGRKDGQINLDVKGGMIANGYDANTFSYDWLNVAKTRSINNLAAGTYLVNAQDTRGCMAKAKVTLIEPSLLIDSIYVLQSFECSSNTKGILMSKAVGGTGDYADYKHVWNLGESTIIYNDTITDCKKGVYYSTITDANGCVAKNSISLKGGSIRFFINPSFYGTKNISCPGLNDGFFRTEMPDAKPGTKYTFIWKDIINNRSLKNSTTDGNIDSLPAGEYSLTISNDLGCSSTLTEVLSEPTPVKISGQSSSYYNGLYNLKCDNINDGSIKLNVSEGHGNYKFNWISPLFKFKNPYTKDQDSLDAGTYIVEVRDTSLIEIGYQDTLTKTCLYKDTFTLTKPLPVKVNSLLSSYNGYQVSCFGDSTGSIKITATGGIGKYHYNWKDSLNQRTYADTNFLTRLKSDTYTLKLAYGDNCLSEWKYSLKEPDSLQINPEFSDYNGYTVSCYGGKNGLVKSNVSGGVKDYNYAWYHLPDLQNVKSSISNPDNLLGGTYKLIVSDNNGCVKSWYINSKEPKPIDAYIVAKKLTCNAANDGIAEGFAKGGITPLTYKWSTNETDKKIDSLPKGNITLIITDANNCVDTVFAFIKEPDPLNVSLQVAKDYHGSPISCYGALDAVLKADVLGGTRPYKYYWNTGTNDTIETVSGLGEGKYMVRVIDSANCKGGDTIEITQPRKLQLQLTHTNVKCFNNADGTATAILTGGIRPYTYRWSNQQRDSVAKNLKEGTYTVYTTDVNGCYKDSLVMITQPDSLRFDSIFVIQPYCPETEDGLISLSAKGGTKPYIYTWSNGSISNKAENLDEGIATISISDSNNCQQTDTFRLKAQVDACLDIPTAFSPNGDNYNRTWNIMCGNPKNLVPLNVLYPNAVVEVYNRWGSVVYTSGKGYNREWNGKANNGTKLPTDSYYYVIDLGNGTSKFKGIISIAR